jgi:hypothetical protein
MELIKKITSTVTVRVDGDTQVDLFRAIGEIEEVFGHRACGKCASENIFFSARHVKEFTYYEMRCRDCNAQLSFGQHRNGETLFVKNRNEDGSPMPNNGWYIYQREGGGARQDSGSRSSGSSGGRQASSVTDEGDIPF